jgi:intein/homing endonuclease
VSKLSPLLREKLGEDPPAPVPVRCVIEVRKDRVDYVVSQLDEMGIRVDKNLISQPVPEGNFYVPAVIPDKMIVEVSKIEGVVSISKSLPRAVGQFKIFKDELLGEVEISAIEVPRSAFIKNLPLTPSSLIKKLGALPGILTGINPFTNVRIFPTSVTATILKDVRTNDGVGQTVAILDTGSPALTHQFVSKIASMEQYSVIPESPEDFHAHGSWCHNCVCGPDGYSPYGKLTGMAPAVEKSIHVKVLSTLGSGATEGILKGIELAVKRGAKVISMSLGGPAEGGVEDDVESKVIDKLTEKGVIFVIAAGNSGSNIFTVGSPGCALKALTVGSVSIMDSFKPAWWSSRLQSEWYGNHQDEFEKDLSKYGDMLIKPDCTATGGGRADKNSKPDEVIWSGASGWFECIEENTPVLVLNNKVPKIKPIKEVNEGDYVYSYEDGSVVARKVLKVMDKGIRDTYKVTLRDREIIATPNHPFLVFNGSKLMWKRLNELKVGDILVVLKKRPDEGQPYKLPDNRFIKETNEDFCKFIGFFLGDGWLPKEKNGYRICIAAPERKIEYAELFRKIFGKEMKYKEKSYTWKVGSKEIYAFLEKIGLGGNAHTKRVPSWVYSLPRSQMIAFLQGYIDADGHVVLKIGDKGKTLSDKNIFNENRVEVTYRSVNKELVEDIRRLTRLIGFRTRKISSVETKYRNKKWIIYESGFTPDEVHFGYLGNHIQPKNKAIQKQINFEHFILRKIENINFNGLNRVFDLTIKDVHNFIANEIVVHNSYYDGIVDMTAGMHGTSQATPHVAGLVACLLSDGVINIVDDIKKMLKDTVNDYIIPDPYNEDEDMKYIEEYGKSFATGWGLFKLSRFRR